MCKNGKADSMDNEYVCLIKIFECHEKKEFKIKQAEYELLQQYPSYKNQAVFSA